MAIIGSEGRLSIQARSGFIPVHAGHFQIHEDQIVEPILNPFYGLLAACGGAHFQAGAFQHFPGHLSIDPIILHKEHPPSGEVEGFLRRGAIGDLPFAFLRAL